MKLLILNGSSCSGKSTIIKYIMKQRENLFHLSYDSLKWSFANYNSAKHYKEVLQIVLAVADTVFKLKYDVICDCSLYKASREELIDLASSAGYEVLEVNLEASPAVLKKRFEERVASALATPGSRISNLSFERFQEIVAIFESEKNPQAITFRTDTQSSEEVAGNILRLF